MTRYKKRKVYPRKEPVEYEPLPSLTAETKKGIVIVLILVIALLMVLALFNLAGELGIYLKQLLSAIFGWGVLPLPLILIILAVILLIPEKYQPRPSNYLGIFLFVLSLSGLLQLFTSSPDLFIAGKGGGYLGYALAFPLQKVMGFWAALIIITALFIISLLIIFNTSLDKLIQNLNIFSFLKRKLGRFPTSEEGFKEELAEEEGEEIKKPDFEEVKEREQIKPEIEEEISAEPSSFTAKKIPSLLPKIAKKNKYLPEGLRVTFAHQPATKVDVPLDLLDGKTSKPTSGDIKANMAKIQDTLKNFGIEVEMGGVNIGPTVTQFTLKPAEGIRLSQIVALQNDLALALAAHPIRIEAPIPGKSLVGVEVPNQSIAIVKLKEILTSDQFRKKRGSLIFALGKDVTGFPWVADLAAMPHLLIAGATGSGKSVCINDIIISFLYQHPPESLRLILIDPKRVEFTAYNGIPHLLTPVITEVDKTINALRWVVNEMDERYRLFSAVGKRNIQAYNMSVITNRLPYIVIIIDELADLMAIAPRDVEGAIIRLAQMARATGIHLVVATQRPSVNVITGLIKANITSRIAFAVASQIDSRTIIDTAGAEKLLGKGDMLFVSAELSKPRRLQCSYVSDEEIERVAEFWGKEAEPEYHDEVIIKQTKVNLAGLYSISEDGDELLEEAKDIILKAGKASASLLQRRLRVGYARAARLLDLLENQGLIGPGDGAKPREVLISESDLAIPEETIESYETDTEDYLENEETKIDNESDNTNNDVQKEDEKY